MCKDEPELQDDDLEERLKTTRNRCAIALNLIEHDRQDLLATILEDLFCGTQSILDLYCVEGNEQS